ncbi:hypothetical protein [Streptomyces sp. NPDC048106]|uniref:hypothetical protein n=1 Tax=Streptomyces sp. NPDC048106 TaxID=3155750 RepID=UPI0034550A08
MVALAALNKPHAGTSMAARLNNMEHHRALRAHLHAAAQSLDEARTTLHTPAPSRPPSPSANPSGPDGTPHPMPHPGETTITNRIRRLDLLAQADRLQQLGSDFDTLKNDISNLTAHPGSELLEQLTPKITQTHRLTGRTLERLTELGTSQYAAVPGSSASLAALSSVVESASMAAASLASAIAANPLDTTDEADHKARQSSAAPRQAELLTEATRFLDLSVTGCHFVAGGILRNLRAHPAHMPLLPQLTDAQYTALEKIGQDGTRVIRSLRGDRQTVRAGDGSTIHAKPFAVLAENRLIRVPLRGTSLVLDVTVTAAGQLILDMHKPARTPTSAPPKAKPAAAAATGHRR